MTIFATGLGPGRSGQTATVTFRINGTPITPTLVNTAEANRNAYTFSLRDLANSPSDTTVTTVPLDISLSVTRSGFLGIGKKTDQVKTRVFLSTFPKHAGVATFAYDVPSYGYVKVADGTQCFRTSDCGAKQCGGGRPEGASTTPVANGDVANPPIGNRLVANPRIDCDCSCLPGCWDPAGCRYVYNLQAAVSTDKRYVDAHWFVTGVWVTMRVNWDTMEFRETGRTARTVDIPMLYGQLFSTCLPPNVDTTRIAAKFVTGQAIEVIGGASEAHRLEFQGTGTCHDGGREVIYRVPMP